MPSPDGFVEFATAHAARLRRAAYLLCGDWHTAQDLTQTALAKPGRNRDRASHCGGFGVAIASLLNSYGFEHVCSYPADGTKHRPPMVSAVRFGR